MKSKKGQLSVCMIVLLVIGIIVALALIPQIFSSQSQMTNKVVVSNEIISATSAFLGAQLNASVNLGPVANVPTGWKITKCPLSNIVVTNATGSVLTVTTDYTLSPTTGVLNLKNTTTTQLAFKGVNNNTLVDYSYCLDGYNTDSGSRGIAQIIGIMTVLSLVVFVIAYGIKEWVNS